MINHEENCPCVICTEWSGRYPELMIPDEDYPDLYEEALGG